MKYQVNIPIECRTDVLVVGGGPAGCAAAWAAARQGMNVLLVEAGACLGGAGTAALVPLFLGLTDGIHFLAGDFARELLDRMSSFGVEIHPERNGLIIHAESLKRAYEDMLLEVGVKILFFTRLAAVEQSEGYVSACVLAGKRGLYAAKAQMYVDGSGDGDLAAWAGAPFNKGDANGGLMGGTLCSLWTEGDWTRRIAGDNRCIAEAYANGILDAADYLLPGMFRLSDELLIGNIGHSFGMDGTEDESLTRGVVRGRALLEQYANYYHRYLSGFERVRLIHSASMIGVRESRIIRGHAQLTLEDFLARRSFDDEIGRFAYCVDIHASDVSKEKYDLYLKEFTHYRYAEGESYGIPFGIIQPQKLENVFIAGRCVSTDRHMQSSIRVMPGCMITGQAAGLAAAQCCMDRASVSTVAVRKVLCKLADLGVYMPNLEKP